VFIIRLKRRHEMGMCNSNLPNLFRFTNWECCNVGKNSVYKFAVFLYKPIFSKRVDSLPSDSCCFVGFKKRVKVLSIIPRICISAAKADDNLNPCCQGYMGV